MKMKGGVKKKSSDVQALQQIPVAPDTTIDLHGHPDSINKNPLNCPSYADPSTVTFAETHQEQNPEDADEYGEEEDEEDDENGEEDTPDGASERPKLDEGFYEIEAIRRKRVRKGELQYLIKWRGWPETANTWEPLENLQSCSDVIDAFEEGLQSGKQRKRKRKHGVIHTQPKKRQQRSTFNTDNVTDVEITVLEERLPSAPHKNSILPDLPPAPKPIVSNPEGISNRETNNFETTIEAHVQNGCQNYGEKGENEYDPKLSELKATASTNTVNSGKLAIQFQEAKTSDANGLGDGLSKVDCGEPVLGNRCTGAKRRKSGSVKRFRQESTLSESGATKNAIGVGSGSRVEGAENSDFGKEKLSRNSKADQARNVSNIAKIIKPIGYSVSMSNNIQDVLVTFMATRSDGTEVMVDNKFLKANNPLLLINFYEQHLRYSATSESPKLSS